MERDDIQIRDFLEAIQTRALPATLVRERGKVIFDEVKITDARGNVSSWGISVELADASDGGFIPIEDSMLLPLGKIPPGSRAIITVESVTHKGNTRPTVPTIITEGKNLGRANATNALTQAIKKAYSMLRLKLKVTDKGTEERKEEGIIFPMLVKKWRETRGSIPTDAEYAKGLLVERKLDGIRTVAHMLPSGVVEMVSRRGQRYAGMDHITRELSLILRRNPSIHLDGEIYVHGVPLQILSGAVRGSMKGCIVSPLKKEELRLTLFDCFNPTSLETPAEARKELLYDLTRGLDLRYIDISQVYRVHNEADVLELARKFEEEGYEGAIVRIPSRGYEPSRNGKHSDNILKIKSRPDAEFQIVDITEGTSGKEVGAIIFICATERGDRFAAVPKGLTYEDRRYLFDNLRPEDVIGKMATIEYSILSENGVPQQPKFKCLRTDTDTADAITDLLLAKNKSGSR